MRTLRDAKIGETVTIKKIHGSGALKKRFLDMGITKGTKVFFRKVAPLGDPMEIRVLDYELTIRKNDAEMIEIEEE
ncbi:MAG TPA: ferrous iron transport protein A [Clostridiaceae bacterium]|nr:ferrous iron transport protein A [Clostridiaceae bacterium]